MTNSGRKKKRLAVGEFNRRQGLSQEVPQCLSHRSSPVAFTCRRSCHLAAHHQQDGFSFENTHRATLEEKQQRGRTVQLRHQIPTRSSPAVAATGPANPASTLSVTRLPAVDDMDHHLHDLRSRSQAMMMNTSFYSGPARRNV